MQTFSSQFQNERTTNKKSDSWANHVRIDLLQYYRGAFLIEF